jgi:DNA-binding CsgD family transcriptional regulator
MVLALLLQGQDWASIAKGLHLSEHTVNDYIKALYKHFGVRHRGQLLAKFMAGNGPVYGV